MSREGSCCAVFVFAQVFLHAKALILQRGKKITYFILRLHWSTVTSISCKKDTFYRVSVLFLQISPETPLITAFHMFSEKRVSALPVVDDNGIIWYLYIFYAPTWRNWMIVFSVHYCMWGRSIWSDLKPFLSILEHRPLSNHFQSLLSLAKWPIQLDGGVSMYW